MEKFWAVILIFVVVAAGGLLYVNQVYNPQKETQMIMAETANQTLSAVKLEMGNDNSPSVVNESSVESTVKMYCVAGNSVEITVTIKGVDKVYTDTSSGIEDQLQSITGKFLKTPQKDTEGKLIKIRFTFIED